MKNKWLDHFANNELLNEVTFLHGNWTAPAHIRTQYRGISEDNIQISLHNSSPLASESLRITIKFPVSNLMLNKRVLCYLFMLSALSLFAQGTMIQSKRKEEHSLLLTIDPWNEGMTLKPWISLCCIMTEDRLYIHKPEIVLLWKGRV